MKIILLLMVLLLCGCGSKSGVSDSAGALSKSRISKKLIISDKKTNVDYFVENNGKELSALKNGKKIWSSNIIDVAGEPIIGAPKIRHIEMKDDKIIVICGKHDYSSVDTKSGEVLYLGVSYAAY